MDSPFCAHKRLRLGCPECAGAERARIAATRPPPPPRPARAVPAERAAKPSGPRPLGRPRRKRSRGVTAEEAENTKAWWVQDRR